MDVLRAANDREAAGHSVIHLEVGQPGTPAPAAVLDAARAALGDNRIGYTDALGIAPLREAIAGHYRAEYGVAVDPAEVVVTTGSSAAFQLAFLAAFESGQRIAVASPGYPAYRNILAALGLEPVLIGVGENAHYQPNPDLLAEAGDIAGLIIASPANPTGTMIPEPELARLAAWCRERGIRLVSDEIYHGITFESAAQTARAYGRDAIIINSFSKYYSMTGWRLGWMLVPPDLARSVECLAQNFYISPPALSQLAALPVFGCRAELDGHVAHYRANRDVLLAMLKQVGLTRIAPADGAFYLYVDVSAVTGNSEEFCRRMLAETGVATTPGRDFDPLHGDNWLRLSFAGSETDITEAAHRLTQWLPRQPSPALRERGDRLRQQAVGEGLRGQSLALRPPSPCPLPPASGGRGRRADEPADDEKAE
jgi:aspartate/methionine/tyrosine aminotransferase